MKRCTHCQICNCELNSDNKVKGYGRCHPCHLVKKKENYYKHRDKELAKKREEYKTKGPEIQARAKKRRLENVEKFRAIGRDYHSKNKEKHNAQCREYYSKNSEKVRAKNRRYYKNNSEKLNENNRIYLNERYKSDYEFNLIVRLRARTRMALKTKGVCKTKPTLSYLGCSSIELQKHLEAQFLEGMTWENKHLWHIDHIIPISSGNNEEEILKLNHYTNLRPMWAEDNIRKSNKIITEI